MIKSLRKRHRQVWLIWLVLLPAGIIFSWLVIPNQQPIKLLETQAEELLPEIISTVDHKDYQANLRSNTGKTHWQLEWKNKAVLTVPSAVIYKVSPPKESFRTNPSEKETSETFKPANSELIGRIEAKGDYVFSLVADSAGYKKLQLVLYDFIHQKVIDTINFQNSSLPTGGGGKKGTL